AAQYLGGRLRAPPEADDDHAPRRQLAVGVQVGDRADLALELLGLQHVVQRAAAPRVQPGGRLAELLVLRIAADHDPVGRYPAPRLPHHADVHRPRPSATASARRIMSMSPSVVSSRSTSSISAHIASSASLAAHSVPATSDAT